jgi:hypothetical protein
MMGPMLRSLARLAPLAALLLSVDAAPIDYTREVEPLLAKHCLKCHGSEKQKGGLRLDDRISALKGGDSGDAGIVPGHAAQSRVLELVTSADADERMPPKRDPLEAREINLLKRWIDEGADWPVSESIVPVHSEMTVTDADREHWAFRPLAEIALPNVSDAPWVRTPVDAFILRAQEEKGLSPSPPADARTLVRRTYFDLVGLPPTPDEMRHWTSALEKSADASSTLVDQLLASPHYGERWARHWLDLARYADSNGMEGDGDRPNAYHFRDFVIRALNDDLHFDTFVRWQLAGDEIAPDNPEAIAATGFIVAGVHTILPDKQMAEEVLRNRTNELDDIVSTTGQGLLALTLACARCHDHKYDPIPSRDYYRLMRIFNSGDRTEVPLVAQAEIKAHREAEAKGQKPAALPTAFAFADFGPEPRESWFFERGDFMARNEKMDLGFLSIVMRGKSADDYWRAAKESKLREDSTLQRRALADWMTDLDHGAGVLLARVMVNRVWQHHFGEGLVRTVSDFGTRGDPPTHPELLEWLTGEFIRSGWSLKHLHRLIVNSATYRQSSSFDEATAALDPENHLLWRRRPLRLESEILRDAMLSVAGTLNPAMFGPSFKPPIPSEALQARNVKDPYPKDAKDTPETRKRTIYMFHKRVVQYPLMQALDAPDAQTSCGRRMNTTVAPQALALLNDPFVRLRAEELAKRLRAEKETEARIRLAFQLCFNRAPASDELATSLDFLTARNDSLTDFCQALFGLNEFLYID